MATVGGCDPIVDDLTVATPSEDPRAAVLRYKYQLRDNSLGISSRHFCLLQLVHSLLQFGQIHEARDAAAELCSLFAGVDASEIARAHALSSRVACEAGAIEDAEEHLANAIAVANAASAMVATAELLLAKAKLASVNRDLTAADSALEAASALYANLEQHTESVGAARARARIAIRMRRFERGLEILAAAASQTAATAPQSDIAAAVNHAVCCMHLGRHEDAIEVAKSAEQSAKARGFAALTASTKAVCAEALRRTGALCAARQLAIDGARVAIKHGRPRQHSICIAYLGRIIADQGRPKVAIRLFLRAIELDPSPRSDTWPECTRLQADCYNAMGDHRRALHMARAARDRAEMLEDPLEVAAAHRAIAVALQALGGADDAKQHFEAALSGFREVGDVWEVEETQRQVR